MRVIFQLFKCIITGPEVVEMRPTESFLMTIRFQSGKLEVISSRQSKDFSHRVVKDPSMNSPPTRRIRVWDQTHKQSWEVVHWFSFGMKLRNGLQVSSGCRGAVAILGRGKGIGIGGLKVSYMNKDAFFHRWFVYL
ncbi:hypothetical protein AKJ16_DCAP05788 [Drosera capensis]